MKKNTTNLKPGDRIKFQSGDVLNWPPTERQNLPMTDTISCIHTVEPYIRVRTVSGHILRYPIGTMVEVETGSDDHRGSLISFGFRKGQTVRGINIE